MKYSIRTNVAAAILAAAGAFCAGGGASAQTAMPGATINPAPFIAKWDRSGKGLLSQKTIDDAAVVKFEALDTKHAGYITLAQFNGLLTPEEFKMANPDGDNSIGIDEWIDLVHHRFERANTDHDGTLDARELSAPRGQALLKLVD